MKPHPIYKVVRKGEYFVNLTILKKTSGDQFVSLKVCAILKKKLRETGLCP